MKPRVNLKGGPTYEPVQLMRIILLVRFRSDRLCPGWSHPSRNGNGTDHLCRDTCNTCIYAYKKVSQKSGYFAYVDTIRWSKEEAQPDH